MPVQTGLDLRYELFAYPFWSFAKFSAGEAALRGHLTLPTFDQLGTTLPYTQKCSRCAQVRQIIQFQTPVTDSNACLEFEPMTLSQFAKYAKGASRLMVLNDFINH